MFYYTPRLAIERVRVVLSDFTTIGKYYTTVQYLQVLMSIPLYFYLAVSLVSARADSPSPCSLTQRLRIHAAP
jgi:hypothetical protein